MWGAPHHNIGCKTKVVCLGKHVLHRRLVAAKPLNLHTGEQIADGPSFISGGRTLTFKRGNGVVEKKRRCPSFCCENPQRGRFVWCRWHGGAPPQRQRNSLCFVKRAPNVDGDLRTCGGSSPPFASPGEKGPKVFKRPFWGEWAHNNPGEKRTKCGKRFPSENVGKRIKGMSRDPPNVKWPNWL